MKVAWLKFPTFTWIGLITDEDAEILVDEFAPPEPVNPDAAAAEASGAAVRLEWPALIQLERGVVDTHVAGAPPQGYVAQLIVLEGVSNTLVDLGAALAGQCFELVEPALIASGDGKATEPAVQQYLARLQEIGIKPRRLGGGRQKIPRDVTS